jgi:NAD(P)-dependent dehydrogenase (short-subunit alcohol dehydrogenase family)
MTDIVCMLHSILDLTRRAAVVTNGSRGLGLQIAEALGEFGARVVITARKAAELNSAVQRLEGRGVNADCFDCDLSVPARVADFTAWLAGRHERADILVKNTGAFWGADTLNHFLEGWQNVFAGNLTSMFLLSQSIGK